MHGVGEQTVVGKVVRILDCFSIENDRFTLAGLTRQSDLPKPTVLRLARMLCAVGMLEHDGTEYRLGRRLYEFGMQVPRERILREFALPYMEELYEMSKQTVQLGIPSGAEVLYIQKMGGHRQLFSPSRLGDRMPLYCTAIGKAMLAHYTADEIEKVIAGGLPRRTPRTIDGAQRLRRELETVRESGIAFEFEESCMGVACVGAPILDDFGRPVAALSISGPVQRFTPRRFASAVSRVAGAVAAAVSGHAGRDAWAAEQPGMSGPWHRAQWGIKGHAA